MKQKDYTIEPISPTAFVVQYHEHPIGQAPTKAAALVMQQEHQKHSSPENPPAWII